MKIYQQLKKLWAFTALLLSLFFSGTAQVIIPTLQYGEPITITKGGTYGGNIRATKGEPAYLVATSEPVVIKGGTAVSNGDAVIKMYGYTNVTLDSVDIIADVNFYGNQRGRAVNNYMPQSFSMTHCKWSYCSGVLVDRWSGYLPQHKIIIKYNVGVNMDKRKVDGYPGSHCQFIQFNTVQNLTNSEIGWNQCINTPDSSWVEDIINLLNTSGTAATPLLVHDNYLNGAYQIPANSPNNFSGSGITIEANIIRNSNPPYEPIFGHRPSETSRFINIYNNTVLEAENAAINIAGGNSNKVYGNTLLNSGYDDKGNKLNTVWSGTAIFNGAGLGDSAFFGNSITGNTIGWTHWSTGGDTYPYPNRQDENADRNVNFMPVGKNTYLPNAPIIKAMIAAQFPLWQRKLRDSGVYVGLVNTLPPVVKDKDTVGISIFGIGATLTLKLGDSLRYTIYPVNADSLPVNYKPGTVTYTSSSTTVARVLKSQTDEKTFSLKALKAGKSTVIIKMTNLAGVTITRPLLIEVKVDTSRDATDILILPAKP